MNKNKLKVRVVFSNGELSLTILLNIDRSWSYGLIVGVARDKLFRTFRDTTLSVFEIEDLEPIAIQKVN